MLALLGHMSRVMLERYSHIRMAAEREAVKALSLPSFTIPTPESTVVPQVSPNVNPPKR